VDLNTPEARGKSSDARFVKKVLTPDEQRAVRRSSCSDRLLWTFWAAKETAYKAVSKKYPDISSAPSRYDVVLDLAENMSSITNWTPGLVHTPKGPVPVRVMHHAEYVHCIGGYSRSGNLDSMEWGIGGIDLRSVSDDFMHSFSERESFIVRRLAASKIAEILRCRPEDIFITRQTHCKTQDPPKVYVQGRPADLDISLSHDGRFAAFAIADFYLLKNKGLK